MATISGVNYKKIVSAGPESYDLVPFDGAGKPLEFMTIEVDSTLGKVDLNLPEAVNFNGIYTTKINVVALTGLTGNPVNVKCSGTDLIGSASTKSLATDGGNVVVTPISATEWSAIVSL